MTRKLESNPENRSCDECGRPVSAGDLIHYAKYTASGVEYHEVLCEICTQDQDNMDEEPDKLGVKPEIPEETLGSKLAELFDKYSKTEVFDEMADAFKATSKLLKTKDQGGDDWTVVRHYRHIADTLLTLSEYCEEHEL